MNAFQIVILTAGLLYIAYVIAEYYVNGANRRKIGKVIHVNGTRGKSTVTRLIDAGLREFGYTVVGKTTGTIPVILDEKNRSNKIFRTGPANVREQLRVVRRAAKCRADFLVVECMAVNPELQYMTEKCIFGADVGVITNVRADHLDEMGEDLESIAYSLANTVPKNGTLVLGEDRFSDVFRRVADRQNTSLVVAEPYSGESLPDTLDENIATALAVAGVLGLDAGKFFEGMRKYVHDPGAFAVYELGSTVFINGFSINDPESTLKIYDEVVCARFPAEKMTVVLNTRPDRLFRIGQHVEMLTKMKFRDVIVTGSNRNYVKRSLEKRGIRARTIRRISDLASSEYVFGCGNAASEGMRIIDYFRKYGVEYDG